MTYRESDIVYETKDFFVLSVGKRGFEIYRTGICAATRTGIVGLGASPCLGLPGAKSAADEKQQALDEQRAAGQAL